MSEKEDEPEDCGHSMCTLEETLDAAVETQMAATNAAARFVNALEEAIDEVEVLAVLASQLAWSLEGDKGVDDERIERRVLCHIEKMGLGQTVKQRLCTHEFIEGVCIHCDKAEPEEPKAN